jgi:thiosulfate/3-mercaptopyruvate sulfurtransferase
LEAWEKVILNQESFFESMHGRYGCITCHGGTGDTDDKLAAHEGVVREPASAEACGDCHPDQVATDGDSLHSNLAGYTTVLAARSAPDKMAQLEVMMGNHCDNCHTTCGQCHVSRPTNLGGGLVAGHEFKKVPPMNLTCTGCHGSRIENEYKGKNEGVKPDVHWVKGGMPCFSCHTADEMHGAMGESDHRYVGSPTPGCQDADCHPDVAAGDGIQQHTSYHFEGLSCQVCHSTTYKNCYSCHVGLENGTAYFKTAESQMMFKIGHNPLQSDDRPWKYVPVRHVPVDPDSFNYYGENLLPNFDALPTWKYATPHNIQRITPQNESCNACHGNAEFFLTAEDVEPDEIEANRDVIVEELPFSMP